MIMTVVLDILDVATYAIYVATDLSVVARYATFCEGRMLLHIIICSNK